MGRGEHAPQSKAARARQGQGRVAELRVASLNLRAYPNPPLSQIYRLTQLIGEQECDVVLLQECLRPWLKVICEELGMSGIHAHNLSPEVSARAFSPDGCAIAVRDPITLGPARRLAPESFMPNVVHEELPEALPDGFEPMPERLAYRFSGRSILAELRVNGETITVGSFHATPGAGSVIGARVREWKPFFHGAAALALSKIESPFAFAIDANEPLAETPDRVTFHWDDARPGATKMHALLGLTPIHRGRDLFREWLTATRGAPVSPELLRATYAPSATLQRRFDSIWATPEFALVHFASHLDQVVRAGGDHALLHSDLLV